MKHTFLILSLLSCLTYAQAEILESSLTFQIKIFTSTPMTESGDIQVENYVTTSLKNSDIIRSIAHQREQPEFSSKAQLIYQTIVSEASAEYRILVRDKGREDFYVTNALEVIPELRLNSESQNSVNSGKTSERNRTGKIRNLAEWLINLRYDPEVIDIQAHGPRTQDIRTVISKEREGALLDLLTLKFTGIGSFNFGAEDTGVAQCSFKISPPKIRPSPPAATE